MNSNFPFTQQLSNNMQKFIFLLKDVYKEYLEEYFPIFVPNIDQAMSNFQKYQLYSWGGVLPWSREEEEEMEGDMMLVVH